MTLTAEMIRNTSDDEELLQKLLDELSALFSSELQSDPNRFHAALQQAPQGLRAMAAAHPLDVSMALDDLAWHFGNHNDERLLRATAEGLRELGAAEAANLFTAALHIVEPYLPEMKSMDWNAIDPADYLERTGIQAGINPLNQRMQQICEECGERGLLQYFVTYARLHPERCVSPP